MTANFPPPNSLNHILRFNPPRPALQSLSAIRYDNGAAIVTWLRSGSGPELALPAQLLLSTDTSTYTNLGTMRRIDGGWRITRAALPLQQTFYLRQQRGQVEITNGVRLNLAPFSRFH